jgi:hypothetical protein
MSRLVDPVGSITIMVWIVDAAPQSPIDVGRLSAQHDEIGDLNLHSLIILV